MDIGIKWGKRTNSAFILPKTSSNAEKEHLCSRYGTVFHFNRRLPLYGSGVNQYFVLTAEYFDGTAFFVNADNMRSAKSIMKDVLTNMGKEDKIHSSSIYIVKGSKYTAEISPLPKDTMEEMADIESGIKDALVKIREVARKYGCDIYVSATDNGDDVDMNVNIEHRGKTDSVDKNEWREWNLRRAEIQSILENSLYEDKREEQELVSEAEELDALIEKWDGVYEW